MIRIFAKKAFGFRHPNTKDAKGHTALVRTVPGQFQEVPDWAGKDELFKLAVAEGSIEVVQTKPAVAVSEKQEKEPEKKSK